MSLPFRILSVQAGTLCLVCAALGVAATLADARSMLMGGFCIVLPNALYAWLTRSEFRPNWVLLLAWFKVVLALVLLTAVMAWGNPRVGWLLAGMGLAYASHMGAALWLTRQAPITG